MDIEGIFEEVSKQMRSDFAKAQKSMTQPGLKGEANEEIVRQFLRQYLPKTLDITSGIIVASTGAQSRQLDIIISDTAKTPILFHSGHIRVIPAECVYAVMEVKAYLDKQELENAYQNMKSVKMLAKTAFFMPRGVIEYTVNLYGKEWHYWPTNHFVFAYDSTNLDLVVKNLNDLQIADEVHQRIDAICILDKGVILNQQQDGKFSALPSPGSRIFPSFTSKSLLLFYTLISVILNQANMDYFNFLPYLQKMQFD